MDIKVALSVLNKSWLIEGDSALNLLSIFDGIIANEKSWKDFRAEHNDIANNIKSHFLPQSNIVFAPDNIWDADEFKGFDGSSVAIIPVQGPLMKNDFCGWFGTGRLKSLFEQASNTPSIKSIVLWVDSPGGTVDGTSAFAEAVAKSKKETYAVVDGMAASAAYWIASSAKNVFATSKTDITGSIGTMVSWWDRSKAMEANGYVLREYYASASVDKNRPMREASQGDGRALVMEMLDPLNNEFLSAVKKNRAGKIDLANENVLTGKVYIGNKSKEVGLIDGIQSFESVIKMASKVNNTIKISTHNTMAFKKTIAASKAEAFTVVAQGDEATQAGFIVSEENLNNVEAHIDSLEGQVQTLTANAAALQATIDANKQIVDAAATSAQSLATANAEITRLQAELAKKPAGEFEETPKQTAEKPAGEKPVGKEKYLAGNRQKGWIK